MTATNTGHLIPAHDREALLEALGAEQIGWHCGYYGSLKIRQENPDPCPDCRRVYAIRDATPSGSDFFAQLLSMNLLRRRWRCNAPTQHGGLSLNTAEDIGP